MIFTLDHTPHRNKSYYLDFIWNISFSFTNYKFINLVTEGNSDSVTSAPFVSEHASVWKFPETSFINYNETLEKTKATNLYLETNGFLPRESISNIEYSQQTDKSDDSPFQQNTYYFEKFVELCNKNNIELILVETPQLNNEWMNPNNSRIMNRDDIEESLSLPIFYSNKSYTNSILFTDEQHLSILGAYSYSIEIANHLGQIFNKNINQKILSSYETFFINQIIIEEQSNGSIYFKIFPVNSLNASYELLVKRNNSESKNYFLDDNFSILIDDLSSISALEFWIQNVSTKNEIRIVIPIE